MYTVIRAHTNEQMHFRSIMARGILRRWVVVVVVVCPRRGRAGFDAERKKNETQKRGGERVEWMKGTGEPEPPPQQPGPGEEPNALAAEAEGHEWVVARQCTAVNLFSHTCTQYVLP